MYCSRCGRNCLSWSSLEFFGNLFLLTKGANPPFSRLMMGACSFCQAPRLKQCHGSPALSPSSCLAHAAVKGIVQASCRAVICLCIRRRKVSVAGAAVGGRAVSGSGMPAPGPVAVTGDGWGCRQRLPPLRGWPCLCWQVLCATGAGASPCGVCPYA